MTTTIKGKDSLIRKLRAFPPRAEQAVRIAMERSAEQIVMHMKSLAPVDRGELQQSISWKYGDAPKGSLKVAQMASAEGNIRITIFAGGGDAFYARWIEFGRKEFVAGGKFAGATVKSTPAQPFFFVAMRANRKSTKSRISRAITKAAKEIAAGG